MSVFLKTRITAVGPEVAELAEGGVLILFGDGAPEELAEVSVLHAVEEGPVAEAPGAGSSITVGDTVSAEITAIGDMAWNKVRDIGHVVVNFNGAEAVERPGEICASAMEPTALVAALQLGAVITIGE